MVVPFFMVFININDHANKIICISDYVMTSICLTFNLIPS